MKPYDGLIFDLDGTLWNSTAPVVKAWNQAASSLGRTEVSYQAVQGIMGLPHQEVFKKIFPDASEEQRRVLEKVCTDREMQVLRDEGGELYPGVEEGLNELARLYPLFIVSNCQSDYLEIFLAKTGLKSLFRDSECYGRTGLSKAENVVLVRERNRLSKPAYLGDTAGDQIAARRAGIDFYHVSYGFGQPDQDCLSFGSFAELSLFFA